MAVRNGAASDGCDKLDLSRRQFRPNGHSITTADRQITAIAEAHGARVATRNVRDFQNVGLEVVNP